MNTHARELLNGAYDIHIHCAPDISPRCQDVLEVAQDAARAGMAGIGIKDHTGCTAGRAYLVNKLYPNGPRCFSALVLNPPVGSINPSAVEAALRNGTDIIYLPTYGAQSGLEQAGTSPLLRKFPAPVGFAGTSVVDSAGEVTSEVKAVLDLIAQFDAVLATGHVSKRESLAVLRAAKELKIRRTLVTHVSELRPMMSLEEQWEAVSYGAFVEHCFLAASGAVKTPVLLEEMARQIRAVGVEHVILSSDFGREGLAKPVDGFADYLVRMAALGFSDAELRTMVRTNPKRLLEKT